MTRTQILTTAGFLAIGTLGGSLAAVLSVPLPYLLGSMVAVTAAIMLAPRAIPAGYVFPQRFRLIFLATIGVMIGAQVTPGLLDLLPAMMASFAALIGFVIVAHGGNYLLFHRLGGYDRVTAFYAASPGGLLESIAMGEQDGADIALLTTQQFLRIVIVITLMPIGLSLWLGAPVGSAAGMRLANASPSDLSHLHEVLLTAALGLGLGRLIRLPAWQLTGPLLAAAAVQLAGIGTLDLPNWVISLCQVVIGTSLGTRLGGLRGRAVWRAVALSLVSVGFMLALGAAMAMLLVRQTGLPFDVLLTSFAPGGVTEMALIALSLQANPALVTAHHIWRILLTVLGLGLVRRYVLSPRP